MSVLHSRERDTEEFWDEQEEQPLQPAAENSEMRVDDVDESTSAVTADDAIQQQQQQQQHGTTATGSFQGQPPTQSCTAYGRESM